MERIPLTEKINKCYLAVDADGVFHTYEELPRRYEWNSHKEWVGRGAHLVGCKAIGYDLIPKELREMTWEDEPKRVAVKMTTYLTNISQSDGLAK